MRRVFLALLLVLTALAVTTLRAPAAWVGDALASRTKLRLVDARGTVWAGSALLGITNGRETTLIPGRLEWQVTRLRAGRLWVRASHDWLATPLELGLSMQNLAFMSGSARVPAAVLAAAGAPFNTLRPGGMLELRWADTEVTGRAVTGELQIDWRDAQSALSPVVPLGTYRLRVAGNGGPPSLDLQTLTGPLQLRGKGTIEGSHIKFSGIATAEREMQPALNGLLGLLGMRSGDKVLLAIDT